MIVAVLSLASGVPLFFTAVGCITVAACVTAG